MTQLPSDRAERFLRHLEPLKAALLAFCRRSLYRRDEVEDVLQSAIAIAFRDFDLYAEGTNFRAWVFRILANEILNRNRRDATRREVDFVDDVADELAGGEAAAIAPRSELPEQVWERMLEDPESVLDACDDGITRSVRELSGQERNVLLLRAIGEFKYREIADILDVPIGTVMGQLSRARQRLREDLLGYAIEHRILPRGGDGPIGEANQARRP